ncbi:MAG: DUF4398 domain-containing protein [Candidatus Obscuribacterales bacterium]|nr:DUF4398 domain-containing protein [Steroidobacteraceae bacterium]
MRSPRVGNLIAWVAIALFGATGLTACASAPVQAMSDARQALRAAQEAGAAQTAPETLSEAQALLARAEAALNKRFFRAARQDAEAAHAKALEALKMSRP